VAVFGEYKNFDEETVCMKEHNFPGTFIVFEGADGSGTTTQAERLVEELDAHYTAEHGDRREDATKIGEKVEEMISTGDYSAEAIALGFAADRIVHLEDIVIPLLKEGKTVVSDRYYHSSLVYQSALGADRNWVEQLNDHALVPDLTIILDVSAEEGMFRIDERGSDGNIFEDMSFQQEVVARYRKLPEELDENITVVDGSKSKDEVFEAVIEEVRKVLG